MLDSDNNFYGKEIEEIVCATDIPFIDAVGANIDAINIIKGIFSERNPKKFVTIFVLSVTQTFIEGITNIKINSEDLLDFLSNQANKNGGTDV